MEPIRCKCCGAPYNPKDCRCGYCGSYYKEPARTRHGFPRYHIALASDAAAAGAVAFAFQKLAPPTNLIGSSDDGD